ncbi:MAG: hypothetical protein R3F56_04120 [Planctomycetota bacterium]
MNTDSPRHRFWFTASCVLGGLALPGSAQCDLTFQPTTGVGTPRGTTCSQVWDPDGAGPLPAVLVVGGRFAIGSVASTSVASWDGADWSPAGVPPMGSCTALAVYGGRLIAAVAFSNLSSDIVAFDGTSWSVLGSMNGVANAMTLYNGNLVVGGPFSWINGVLASGVVQWNGATWSAIGVGAGGVSGTVRALAVFSGSLYVGGDITHASGVPVGNLAIWNGSSWAAGASFDSTVQALATRITSTGPGSALFVGGRFTTVGVIPAQGIARFDLVNSWAAMGAGVPGGCSALLVRGVGLTGFELTAGSFNSPAILRFSGGSWSAVGTEASTPASLALFNGNYIATGAAVRVLAADGAWIPLCGTGIDGYVRLVHETASDLVIAGGFVSISGVRMNGIARGGVGAWQPLGGGVQGGEVLAVASMPNGDIVAAGTFSSAGGVSANRIARWNGSAWSALGAGLGTGFERVLALAVYPNGTLVAAGSFTQAGGQSANRVAAWNGTGWAALGAGFDADLGSLAILPNGELVAGGNLSQTSFLSTPGRWNGSSWLPFPSYPNGAISALAVMPNGELLVGGFFERVGSLVSPFVVRWNGSGWVAVPGFTFGIFSSVDCIVPLPNGHAILDGGLQSGSGGARFARFDGRSVTPLPAPGVRFLHGTVDAAGDVLLVGDFAQVHGVTSGYIARLDAPCVASATSYGSGCSGSSGANRITPTHLPWLGTTFRADVTGLPINSLAVGVFGLTATSMPLRNLLPQALPGCLMLTSLELLQVLSVRIGATQSQLALPAQSALIGQVLHHQVVTFELDGGSSVTAVTSSNGLRLTIGTY